MPLDRPSLEELDERVRGDLRDNLGLGSILRRSFLRVISKMIAGVAHLLFGSLEFISRQIFPDQAEVEYLDRWGSIYDIPRREATFAVLDVKFTGTDGTVIPVNTEVTRDDTFTYNTDEELTIQTAVAALPEITDVTTLADSSGSLDGTYFELYTPDEDYYIWFDVDAAGNDPSVSFKTGIQVSIARNDSAITVASALQLAVDGSIDFVASVVSDVVTISNATDGAVQDVNDGTLGTGFTLTVTQQGVDGVTGGEVTGTVTASTSGSSGNLDAGETLSLSSAITDVDSNATVTGTDTEGEDRETDDSYRARLLERIRNKPQGGAHADYIQWALEVPGITRAWVRPGGGGPGSVVVYVVEDDEEDIFPDSAKLQEVQEYIDERRPVTANVFVVAPVRLAVDMTIQLKPNTTTVQANVTSQLQDLIRREAVPHDTVADPSTNELNDGTLLISKINEAISIAQGEEDHVLVIPTANVATTTGEMVDLGTITWQAL